MPAVALDEAGPLAQLGEARRQVRLQGEEGREGVGGRVGEGFGGGGGGGEWVGGVWWWCHGVRVWFRVGVFVLCIVIHKRGYSCYLGSKNTPRKCSS